MDVTAVPTRAATSCDRRVFRKRLPSSEFSKRELKKEIIKKLDKIKIDSFFLVLLGDW